MSNAAANEISSDVFIEIGERVLDLTTAELADDHEALLAGYLQREIAKRQINARHSGEITMRLCQLVGDDVIELAFVTGVVLGRFDNEEAEFVDNLEQSTLLNDSFFR